MVNRTIHLGKTPLTAPFTGAVDIIPSPLAWWGFSAMSTAAIGGNAVDLVRNDAATMTVVTVAGGGLDSAVVAWMSGHTAKISRLYDQTGGGLHLLQATGAAQPAFTLTASGSLPGLIHTAGVTSLASSGSITSQNEPYSIAFTAKRHADFTTSCSVFSGTGGNCQTGFLNSGPTVFMHAGAAAPTVAAADSAFHAVMAMFDGSVQDKLIVNGISNNVATSNNLTLSGAVGSNVANSGSATVLDIAVWAGDKSASGAALSTQAHTYWGF